MRTDSVALAFVQACGPTLVLLFAVLLVAVIVQKNRNSMLPGRSSMVAENTEPVRYGSGELGAALENATALNSFDLSAASDPRVRLQAALRFTPTDYRVATYEISRRFKEGRVISVDLARMDARQAVRLVDFCSGMTTMCSGWIFRVSDGVIILTPPS